MKRFSTILLYTTLLFLIIQITEAKGQNDMESYTKIGQEMPSFSFTTIDNKEIKINELKGKVIYINFWATWCGPCLAEMPRIEKEVWKKYKTSEDFVMVAIAREQTKEEIIEFNKRFSYTFPFAPDVDRQIYKKFGNGGIPRSYVVGKDGKILYQSVGYSNLEFDSMLKILEKALEK